MIDSAIALVSQGLSLTSDYVLQITSSPKQIAAHLAALIGVAFVTVAAFVRTMIPLRWMAVGSNIGLLLFGALHPSIPTMLVAGSLLPINVWRAIEMMRLTKRVNRAAGEGDLASIWLKPYMKPRRLRAGRVLFHKGDHADRLYLLTDGELELVEIGLRMQPGRIFGEIALFSPERKRTRTARAVTRCVVLEIHESTVRQLYFQNPAFGFHLIELLAERLSTDVQRAEGHTLEAQQALVEATQPQRRPQPADSGATSAPAADGTPPREPGSTLP